MCGLVAGSCFVASTHWLRLPWSHWREGNSSCLHGVYVCASLLCINLTFLPRHVGWEIWVCTLELNGQREYCNRNLSWRDVTVCQNGAAGSSRWLLSGVLLLHGLSGDRAVIGANSDGLCQNTHMHTQAYTHTVTHSHMHTRTHTYTVTHTVTHTHSHTHTYTNTHKHTHTHTVTHTYIQSHTRVRTHTHACAHTVTHTHTQTSSLTHTTHTRTHTQTHKHTHSFFVSLSCVTVVSSHTLSSHYSHLSSSLVSTTHSSATGFHHTISLSYILFFPNTWPIPWLMVHPTHLFQWFLPICHFAQTWASSYSLATLGFFEYMVRLWAWFPRISVHWKLHCKNHLLFPRPTAPCINCVYL